MRLSPGEAVCVWCIFPCVAGGGVGGGQGGQVFVLTRFNEGCVCVCKCLFAFGRVCFHGEHTSTDMDGWKLPVLLCAPLRFLHSIFV